MKGALLLVTVIVPLYTALLHGWIWAWRRRETEWLAFALSALAMAGVASGVIAQANAASPESAYRWQQLQLGMGAAVTIGLPCWAHRFLGLRRPWVEAGTLLLALVTLHGIGQEWVFSRAMILLPTLLLHPPAWHAPATKAGLVLLSGYALAVVYLLITLGAARRRAPQIGPLFASYALFASSLLYDAARGAGILRGPELLPFGYLAMVVGISAVTIRRFVRSVERASRLASAWHEEVETRSAELRRKELQLVHGERLATLGTLAAGVAHEINDPMAFVSSNLNRVEESWHDPRERGDVPEILAECREGLARLRRTVTELLRLARGSDADSLPTDLAEVVASVLPLVRAEARFGVRLECDLTPVPAVRGNPGLLAQVALQLVLNAVRATPEGRSSHRVRVATRAAGDRVLLEVHDEGAPLPPELVPQLFDPFASLAADPAPDAGAAPGARLGLAVTHQIVTRHGGRLAVESHGGGTVFTVSLPALATPGERSAADAA